jgi:phosphoserine aminotransferase
LSIPRELLPADGRFGCGPSKVRPEQLEALVAAGTTVMGTSHRQAPVKQVVGRVRAGLRDLFGLPDGWEVVLGNGGTTGVLGRRLVRPRRARSAHLVFGEFSSKFAEVCAPPPPRRPRTSRRPTPATTPTPSPSTASTSTPSPTTRRRPASPWTCSGRRDRRRPRRGRRHVRGRRAAVGPAAVDVYYFAPQKCFASDGGLWVAACSPAAVERIERLAASGPLASGVARPRDRPDQQPPRPDLQHPGRRHPAAVRRPAALDERLGRLDWCVKRSQASSGHLYEWAEAREWATPFVADPAKRSAVVGTIDLDASLVADKVCAALRANGIVDTDSYRKLGRNQLRIGMFPAIEPADVEALTACIDHLVEHHADSLAP